MRNWSNIDGQIYDSKVRVCVVKSFYSGVATYQKQNIAMQRKQIRMLKYIKSSRKDARIYCDTIPTV